MRNHLLMAALGAAMCVSSFGCGDDGSMPIVHDDAAMPSDTDGGGSSGTLEVSADVGGGTIFVDRASTGQVMDAMPMAIALPEGLHYVSVHLAGYVAAEPTVEIRRNETTTVMVAVGRDLTGSWACTSGMRSASMLSADAVNEVIVLDLYTGDGIVVSGDSLSLSNPPVTITGAVSGEGRVIDYTLMGAAGTRTEHCTR